MPLNAATEFDYQSPDRSWSNGYLWPPLMEILASRVPSGAEIMELGSGSGATAGMLSQAGFKVTAVDPSSSGIAVATKAYPGVRFRERSAYDDLAGEFGRFDAVVSLEVVEHCYWPRSFAATVFSLLRTGGWAVVSTPFHGYWKNLALALAGKFDSHWDPLWDGGHIKFWSENTLNSLLLEVGFGEVAFRRVGRIRALAKSMIAVARRTDAESEVSAGNTGIGPQA